MAGTELKVRVCAVFFWIYQPDGMDGKQAEDGTGSPLGEVVDHGCDAFACAYATILCDAFAFDARTNRLLVRDYKLCQMDEVDTVTNTYQGCRRLTIFSRNRSDHMPDYVFAHGVSRAERLEGAQCSCSS